MIAFAGTAQDVARVSITGVSKSYPGTRALIDLDLAVMPGEVHGIAGQNGAGKSTLVRILSGVERPDTGTIRLDGEEVSLETPQAAQRAQIMTVHQELSLIPYLSVAENIFVGDMPRTRAGSIAWRRLRRDARQQLLALGFDIDVRKPVSALPIAHRQAVEIAKAISRNARVLILDEPTATLPRHDVAKLFELLRRLRTSGIAIIFISHHFDEMYEICDTISVFRDGRRVAGFVAEEENHDAILQAMLGSMNPEDSQRLQLGASDTPRLGLGRVDGEVALEVQGLSDDSNLSDVDLVLHRGEVLGVAGLSGSGQTQLAAALFGAQKYSVRSFTVSGRQVGRLHSPANAVRLGLGLLPEERKSQGLILPMSITRNITLAALGKFSRLAVIDKRKEAATGQRMRTALSIKAPSLGRPVATLSGGNQQKVALAKWLVSGVRTLIFVEPTRGVDVGAKLEIYELIRGFVEGGGSAIIITSEIDEALMCDRVAVLRRGTIVATVDRPTIERDGEVAVMKFFA